MENEELHPVVQLLLARMESHPEEFRDQYLMSELSPINGDERWDRALLAIKDNGSEQDLEAINKVLGAIRMNQIHEWVMDELCNGEERRRKQREEIDTYRNLQQAQQVKQSQLYQQAQLNQSQAKQSQLHQTQLHQVLLKQQNALANNGLVNTIKKGLRIK